MLKEIETKPLEKKGFDEFLGVATLNQQENNHKLDPNKKDPRLESYGLPWGHLEWVDLTQTLTQPQLGISILLRYGLG